MRFFRLILFVTINENYKTVKKNHLFEVLDVDRWGKYIFEVEIKLPFIISVSFTIYLNESNYY